MATARATELTQVDTDEIHASGEIMSEARKLRTRLDKLIESHEEKQLEAQSKSTDEMLSGQRFLRRYYGLSESDEFPVMVPDEPEMVYDKEINDEKEVSYYCQYLDFKSGMEQTIFVKPGYKTDIISLMHAEKLEDIEFDDNDGDLVYVFWQDRYDMWNRDPIVKVSIKNNDLVFDCKTDNDETVTLYSSSDYGCDLVEVLSDILLLIQEYVSQLEPACPYCGSREPRDGKNALLICTDCGNEYWPGQSE